jgi:N6-adenosine-specific RNA methylase IME4
LHVADVDDLETLDEYRRKSAALERYLRDKELQRPMLGAQRRIEARIGQLLGEPEKGGRGNKGSAMPEGFDAQHLAADFRILSKSLGDDCELTDDEWRKSRRALVSLVRNRLGLMPETPELPAGVFRCIVADPPWKLDTGPDVFNGTGERGHDNLAYEQMGLEQIKELPVADRAADDSHLYLWTTNKYVEASYSVARAWGFKPSVLLVWAKTPRGVGLGDAYRLTTEFILYARRGSLKEKQICKRTWFNWKRGKHSEKPDEFYDLVESMTPAKAGERLEMFARKKRRNWKVWGHEA